MHRPPESLLLCSRQHLCLTRNRSLCLRLSPLARTQAIPTAITSFTASLPTGRCSAAWHTGHPSRRARTWVNGQMTMWTSSRGGLGAVSVRSVSPRSLPVSRSKQWLIKLPDTKTHVSWTIFGDLGSAATNSTCGTASNGYESILRYGMRWVVQLCKSLRVWIP